MLIAVQQPARTAAAFANVARGLDVKPRPGGRRQRPPGPAKDCPRAQDNSRDRGSGFNVRHVPFYMYEPQEFLAYSDCDVSKVRRVGAGSAAMCPGQPLRVHVWRMASTLPP